MSASSMEAVGFAVVLGALAIAALVSMLRRPPDRRDVIHRGDHRR
jgi:hypothetical protein